MKPIIEILGSSTECCGKVILTGCLQDNQELMYSDEVTRYTLNKGDRLSKCSCGQIFIRQWSKKEEV